MSLCVSVGVIPLKEEIQQITYAIFRGRSGGGARYAFYIEQKWKNLPFFLEKASRMKGASGETLEIQAYGFKVDAGS